MDSDNSSFLGTGWSFPTNFSKEKKGIEMVSREEDINQSLKILLSTSIGERIMQLSYGCDLSTLLYESIDLTLITFVRDLIETAILYHEPRILLENLELELDGDIDGMIWIKLEYRIRTTNTRHNYVYPFYKLEGTSKA